MGAISNVDFNRPIGKCGKCGHQTYMIQGSDIEEVCPWCRIMRLLVPLRLPVDVIEALFGKITNRHPNSTKLRQY